MAISFLDGVAYDQSVIGAEHALRRIRSMKLGRKQESGLNGLFPLGAYIYLIQIENRRTILENVIQASSRVDAYTRPPSRRLKNLYVSLNYLKL